MAALPFTVNAADETAVGESFKISIGGDSRLNAAAEYLNRYVDEICGYSLEITDSIPDENVIVLDIDESAEKGYSIKAEDSSIFITGSTLRNTVDGICAFLTRYGGINYYTSRVIVKSKDEITIPADENYTYTPYFESTETDWFSPCDVDYSLFNGISGTQYRKFPAELGGGADYITGFAHTLTGEFCSSDKYFESNPECFALCAGIRSKKNLCLSNPKTLEIVTGEVMEHLKERHNPDAVLQIVSLTQPDNIIFCTCPKCAAKYIKYGSISGVMVEFANSVARTVKDAGYDNVAIDTFAYLYTRSAPKNIVPDDNVIIRLCSLECCFSHGLNDKTCAVNMGFATDLKNWGEICDRVYVWDYVTNFCNYIGIFPNFDVLQKNMQFFYENNVKGVYEEGNYSASARDTEFCELRAYLIAKLMQNPYCDIRAERDAFLSAYYGEGGQYIGEFIDIISKNASTEHMSIYTSMRDTCNLTCAQIKKCDSLWESAKAASEGEQLGRVVDSELAWRYWKYENNVSEFFNIFTRGEMREQFDEDIAAAELKAYRECSDTKAFFLGIFQKLRLTLSFVIYPFEIIKSIL